MRKARITRRGNPVNYSEAMDVLFDVAGSPIPACSATKNPLIWEIDETRIPADVADLQIANGYRIDWI